MDTGNHGPATHQYKPDNYRPLCTLSHVRKEIDLAVVDELDEITHTYRMQFGFQRLINTLQAAVDVAAVLNEAAEYLVAVIYLTKAYDRVVRALMMEKFEKIGVPQDLINQIILFLVPLLLVYYSKRPGTSTHSGAFDNWADTGRLILPAIYLISDIHI